MTTSRLVPAIAACGVLMSVSVAASARVPLKQRARQSVHKLKTTFQKSGLSQRLATLGNSVVGRTVRRCLTTVTPLNAHRIGKRDNRMPAQRWLPKLEPVARNFVTERARLSYASGLLGGLTPNQQTRLLQAHHVAQGELGIDGRKAAISASGKSNYSYSQRREKIRKLRDADFSRDQRRKLMQRGVVGKTETKLGLVFIGSGIGIGAAGHLLGGGWATAGYILGGSASLVGGLGVSESVYEIFVPPPYKPHW